MTTHDILHRIASHRAALARLNAYAVLALHQTPHQIAERQRAEAERWTQRVEMEAEELWLECWEEAR